LLIGNAKATVKMAVVVKIILMGVEKIWGEKTIDSAA
jgi:hypothetical protein